VREFFRKAFRLLPAPIKAAYAGFRDARCEVWILTGRESSSGEPLCVAYAGRDAAKAYLINRLFKGDVRVEPLGCFRRDLARKEACSRSGEIDLFFGAIPPSQEAAFRPDVFAVLPGWVCFEAALGAESRLEKGKKFRKIRDMVALKALTREVTRDPVQFERFYRDVYIPFVTARHEDAASPLSPEAARKRFVADGCELVWVRKDGVMLGGAVMGREDGAAVFWLTGIAAGVPDDLAADANSAVYYHVFMRAKEMGFSRLNLGYCRPFLADGIARYKMGFGAYAVKRRMEDGGLLALEIVRETRAVKNWLKCNPFVAVDRGGRYSVSGFIDAAQEGVIEDIVDSWRQRYCVEGGLDLRVYALSPRMHLEREVRFEEPR
jgi:hypothetical protein